MCGIFFVLLSKHVLQNKNFDINNIEFDLLKKRGPNNFDIIKYDIDENYVCYFAASVLSLRGTRLTKQPITSSTEAIGGSLLLWNGEIFSSELVVVNQDENDGMKLYEKLNSVCENEDGIYEIMGSIKGPYGFLFYDHTRKCIYFGRDRFGRRSLLRSLSKENVSHSFMLSSVRVMDQSSNIPFEFEELKANGVYKIDLNEKNFDIERSLSVIEWSKDGKLMDKISEFNEDLSPPNRSQQEFDEIAKNFLNLLEKSVHRRINPLPELCKSCYKSEEQSKYLSKCQHSRVAILFSGGLDSAVLAALVDRCLPADESIDLLNIAFEQANAKTDADKYLVPDRQSGLECLKELNKNRKWNFVEINVTYNELQELRAKQIKNLIYPLQTVLDDSIGCAIWFASRGSGLLNSEPYQSNAEVLLLGMGADEQLGGYARHRTRYRNEGWYGLAQELKMEMKRISERNLGRDDRIISDHGKESRLPYLDEDLVDYLNKLTVFDKVNFDLPRGYGEKYLLRYCAQTYLGLKFASQLAKRAIQFGSRVAKLENSKEKASDKCNRLADDD